MPMKYIGLDVLEYERDLIKSKISEYEMTIFEIPEWSWYTDLEKKENIQMYESFIEREQSKLNELNAVIDKYYHGFYSESSYSSSEPLQEYYQKQLESLIYRFKKDIEKYYDQLFNTFMSSGHISITYFAKTHAKEATLYYGIKSIVTEYLLDKQIFEINCLSKPKKEQLKAIDHKYDFFKEYLIDCFTLIQTVKSL